jgi:hypothetical protein
VATAAAAAAAAAWTNLEGGAAQRLREVGVGQPHQVSPRDAVVLESGN